MDLFHILSCIWLMYSQVRDFCVSRGLPTVQRTQIVCNLFFFQVPKSVLIESEESYSDQCASGIRATRILVTWGLGVALKKKYDPLKMISSHCTKSQLLLSFLRLHFGVLQQYKNSSSSPYFISYTFDVLSLGTFVLLILKFF